MQQLFYKLERPVLTNIELNWQNLPRPESYPVTVPDLYAGEPLVVQARWPSRIDTGTVEVKGYHNGRQWRQTLQIEENNTVQSNSTDAPVSQSYSGLDKLWANRKIQSLEDSLLFDNDLDNVESAITRVALDYGLVTRFTSLIAVDETPVRDNTQSLAKRAVPSALPHGNAMHLPQGSLGINLRLLISALFSVLAIVFGLATLHGVREL